MCVCGGVRVGGNKFGKSSAFSQFFNYFPSALFLGSHIRKRAPGLRVGNVKLILDPSRGCFAKRKGGRSAPQVRAEASCTVRAQGGGRGGPGGACAGEAFRTSCLF